jgi:hypothetical protein
MAHHFTTDRHPAHRRPPSAPAMPINDLLAAFVAELEAEGIPAPLGQPLTLGLVWADLCRLAGEEPPPAVAALLGEPVAA